MKTAAQAIHPLREFGKSKINNAQVARALSEYLGAANPSGNIRREHIFLRAPHWHNTCNCRCNGRKHETSRTPHLVCNLVSVASRAASRRVLPGLWRTGRPATAPSPGERDGRAGGRVRPAGRAANIHRDGQQHDKYSRELEREWNTRRERDGWNGRRGRRLLGPCESSCARFGVRAGHQRGGLLKDFGLGRADRERHFRLGLSRGGPARTRRHHAVLSHGEFSRQSQSSRRLDAFRQRMHGSRVRNRGFLRDVHGAADSYFPARRFPDRHKRGRSIQESHRDHYRHESFSLAVTGPTTLTAGGTATYAATLTPAANSNPSRVISWSVAGTGCAAAACGTISPSGFYAAPAFPPSPATVQILATPQGDPLKATSVSLLILPAVSVSVSPSAATVPLGSQQSFQAVVTGAQDTSVTWDVNGLVDGNPTLGSILNSQTAPDITTYAAPQAVPAGGSVTVRARSNANPNFSASATIAFTAAVSVTLTPASATLAVSHRQTFTALVNNTPNQNVTWLVNGVAGGNLATGRLCAQASNPCQPVSSSNGGSVDYVAPAGVPSPDPVTITATSPAITTPSA